MTSQSIVNTVIGGHFDMTAATGAPPAAGDLANDFGTVPRVVYRWQENHIHEIAIYPQSGTWGHYDMTDNVVGNPMGYMGEVPRVIYRDKYGNVLEFTIHREPKSIWASNTHGNPGSRLILEDDGEVGLDSPNKGRVWSTYYTGEPTINYYCAKQ